MSAVTVTNHKTRRHRGVVPYFIDDIFPSDWADWMDIPAWPETVEEAPLCGLGPKRWRHLADYAKTLQEHEVATRLGDYATVTEVAAAMGLSGKRVQQIGRGLLDRVAKPQTAHQADMFEDDSALGGDK